MKYNYKRAVNVMAVVMTINFVIWGVFKHEIINSVYYIYYWYSSIILIGLGFISVLIYLIIRRFKK